MGTLLPWHWNRQPSVWWEINWISVPVEDEGSSFVQPAGRTVSAVNTDARLLTPPRRRVLGMGRRAPRALRGRAPDTAREPRLAAARGGPRASHTAENGVSSDSSDDGNTSVSSWDGAEHQQVPDVKCLYQCFFLNSRAHSFATVPLLHKSP